MGLFDKARDRLKQLQSEQGAAAEYWSDFTPRVNLALASAREEARKMNRTFIDTDHLLLGLLELGNGVAVNVLKNVGLNTEFVRAEASRQGGVSTEAKSPDTLVPAPRFMRVLDAAKRETKALGFTYVGTESILLGLLAEPDGSACQIFNAAQIDREAMRREILKEITPVISPPTEGQAEKD